MLGRLAKDEATLGARLKDAKTPKRLATQLGGLEDAYGRAAQGIGKLDAAPFEQEATDAIQARLKRLQDLYGTLTTAARRRQASRYRATSHRIETRTGRTPPQRPGARAARLQAHDRGAALMDPQRRRTLVAAVIVGVVFAGASYAIGQQIKQSTEETASGAPPAATITSEAVLVPARGPSLPGLPRRPKKPTTDGTTGTTSTTGTTTTTPSTDNTPTDNTPTDNSTHRQHADRQHTYRLATDNTPTDNTPTDNTPTDNTPTDNTPTDNMPTDIAPTDFSGGDTTTTTG